MDATEILRDAVQRDASDIFIVPGIPLAYKLSGHIAVQETQPVLTPADSEALIATVYELANHRDMKTLKENGDDDFSFSLAGVSRFRVNTYKQRSSLAAIIRVVNFDLPNPQDLGLPSTILDLANRKKGLVLVTGPAGSGKSTTLACIIDQINNTRSAHVITLEDPIEYLHRHKKSIVSQREISTDTTSYLQALRASLRQAPDVILLGELRDHETIATAMTAAETGHLVLSTLHTVGTANTIDRIVDAFPPNQQPQIRIQLAMVLQAVVSQQLIPTADEQHVVPAFEIMFVNPAIRNMIRENKVHQIDTVIFSSANEGMVGMDTSLLNLYKKGVISKKDALLFSPNPDTLSKKML